MTITLGVSEEVPSILISPPVAAISPLSPLSPLSPFGPFISPTLLQSVNVSDQTYRLPFTKYASPTSPVGCSFFKSASDV